MNGILNIYKEAGYTSHDVVSVVKKILNCKSAGHTGTLDPQAEGVLPICIGKATKVSSLLTSYDKTYEAEVTLGITTTTDDSTGEIIETKEINFDKNNISEAVASFKGESYQIPPMYSAIKVNGQRLYKLAREGKVVEREPRKINIYEIGVKEFILPNKFKIYVKCSKGTYIRTLCFDIGRKLGCGAHMSSLVRTNVDYFNIDESIKLEQLKVYKQNNDLDKVIIKIDEVFKDFPKFYIKKEFSKILYNGNIIYDYGIEQIKNTNQSLTQQQNVLVYDYNFNLIGIYYIFYDKDNRLFIKPNKMLIDSNMNK